LREFLPGKASIRLSRSDAARIAVSVIEVEKRAGAWEIVKRQAVYDMASFNFPYGIIDLDAQAIQKYPSEYAALAYLLDKRGFPVRQVFATKASVLGNYEGGGTGLENYSARETWRDRDKIYDF
jgi:hypothetical protein